MMKKKICLIILMCGLFLSAAAQSAGATADTLALLAARGDVATLRPLYEKAEKTLPHVTRLYCRMALAHADGEFPEMVACIDTLLQKYPRRLGTKGRLALVELKASGLLRQGSYDELTAFCRKELATYKKRRFKKERLLRLQAFLDKASRFSGDAPRARMLGLVDRGLVFALDTLFRQSADSVDAYARYRSALLLDAAYGRDAYLLRDVDSLLTLVPDSLDEEDFSTCVHLGAEALVRAGRWSDLSAFVSRCEAMGKEGLPPLDHYRLWSKALAPLGSFRLVRPSRAFSLPVSRDWPLFVQLSLNKQKNIPFLVDTGEGHTLLSSAAARSAGLEVLADTLMLSTSMGLLAVSPAVADSLTVGEAVMQGLPVFVVLENGRLPEGCAGILGNGELRRLGKIRFFEEKLEILPSDAPAPGGAMPNMRLSSGGSLLISATCESRRHSFGLDSGSAGNVFSSIVFPRSTTDTLYLRLTLGDATLTVPDLSLRDRRLPDRDGALGAPFLRSFHDVTVDYAAMRITVSQPTAYTRREVFDYIESGDLFALERNAASLSAVADAHDAALMRLHIDGGKNEPDGVAEEAARLMDALDRNDGRNVNDEYEYLMMYRINALVSAGRYKDAAEIIDRAAKEGLHSGPVRDMLLDIAATCRALVATPPTSVTSDVRSAAALPLVEAETGPRSVAVRVNKKAAFALVDPSREVTELSEKTARRLRLRIVHKHAAYPYSVAIIDSLRLGDVVARDVLCHVYPGKERFMAVGFNVLRHLDRLCFTRDSVRLTPAVASAAPRDERSETGWLPLRFDDKLCVQGESLHRFLTFSLTPSGKPATAKRHREISLGDCLLPGSDFVPGDYASEGFHLDGTLSLDYLVEKTGRVCFDFPAMRMKTGKPSF